MVTLIAKALDIPWMSPGPDHIYVESSSGFGPWGCFGRSAGGYEVARGVGSGEQADFLSQPRGTTGLVYGVEGVCHQAANRILIPAGVTVLKAPGVLFTYLIYGVYGNAWSTTLWLATRGWRCSLWSSPLLTGPKGRGKERTYMEQVNALYIEAANTVLKIISRDTWLKKHMEQVNASYDKVTSKVHEIVNKVAQHREVKQVRKDKEEEILTQDVRLMVDNRLGSVLDVNNINWILNLRADFIKEKRRIDKALASFGRGGREGDLELNEQFRKLLKRIEKAVGPVIYEKLFGRPPEVSYTLIDPEIAGAEARET